MEIKKIIESVGKDGKKVLSNILNKNTGRYLEYKEVEGITDQDVLDGKNPDLWDVYIKYKDGKYYIMSEYLDKGKLFLEKDSIAEVRAMSTSEILLLKIGYYKGVRVNGYYEKGDTPAPIEYFLSDTEEEDDGGSILNISNVKLETEFRDSINPLYFGANESITDCSNYINKASEISQKIGLPLKSSKEFTIGDTVFLRESFDLKLIYNGEENNTAVICGAEDSNTRKKKYTIKLRKEGKVSWENEEEIGIIFINIYESKIYLDNISGFSKGVILRAENSIGFVYNSIYIGNLENNQIQLHLSSLNKGWVNENEFFAGRFWNHSSLLPDKERVGILIGADDENTNPDAYVTNNNNIFYKPSFEMRNNALPILIKGGRFNQFLNVRDEGNGRVILRSTGKSYVNKITIGFMIGSLSGYNDLIEDLGDFPSTIIKTNYYDFYNDYKSVATSSLNFYDNLYQISDRDLASKSSYIRFINRSTGAVTLRGRDVVRNTDSRSIDAPQGICPFIRIDCSNNKRFRIKHNVYNNHYGRIYMKLYNNNNENISNLDNIKTTPSNTDDWISPIEIATQYGGSVRETGNRTNSKYYCVSKEVSYVDIIFVGENEGVSLISVDIDFLDYRSAIIPVSETGLVSSYADSQITSGYYYRGQFLHYSGSDQSVLGYKNISGDYSNPNFVEISAVRKTTAPPNVVQALSSEYSQSEVQGILNELRALKSALKDSNILS